MYGCPGGDQVPIYTRSVKTFYHKTLISEKISVVILKFELCGFTIVCEICPKDADGMANSVDPDQTAHSVEQRRIVFDDNSRISFVSSP